MPELSFNVESESYNVECETFGVNEQEDGSWKVRADGETVYEGHTAPYCVSMATPKSVMNAFDEKVSDDWNRVTDNKHTLSVRKDGMTVILSKTNYYEISLHHGKGVNKGYQGCAKYDLVYEKITNNPQEAIERALWLVENAETVVEGFPSNL